MIRGPYWGPLFPVLVFVILGTTNADYQCICNYDHEAKIYSTMSSGGVVVARMSEFQCQPLKKQYSQNWASVDIAGQASAFVQTGGMILVQTCPGDPPTNPPTTTATTTTSTTTTTTPRPRTTTHACLRYTHEVWAGLFNSKFYNGATSEDIIEPAQEKSTAYSLMIVT